MTPHRRRRLVSSLFFGRILAWMTWALVPATGLAFVFVKGSDLSSVQDWAEVLLVVGLFIGLAIWFHLSLRQIAEKHAATLPQPLTMKALWNEAHKPVTKDEKPEKLREKLQAEYKSFKIFLVDGVRGRGWRMPSPAAEYGPSEDAAEAFRRELAHTIREARLRSAMTQEHLAAAAQVSDRTVRRIEATGKASFESIRAVCAVLGTGLPEGRPDVPAARWPEMVKAAGLTVMAMIMPLFALGVIVRTRRGHAVVAGIMAVVAGLAYVAWRDQLMLVPEDIVDPMWSTTHNNGVQLLREVAWTVGAGFVGSWLAGIVVGMAFRSSSKGAAATGYFIGGLVFLAPVLPAQALLVEISKESGRTLGGMEHLEEIVDTARHLEEVDPDFTRADGFIMTRKFIHRTFGIDTPAWMLDRDTVAEYLRLKDLAVDAFNGDYVESGVTRKDLHHRLLEEAEAVVRDFEPPANNAGEISQEAAKDD